MNTNEINKITTLIDQLLKMSGSKDDPTTLEIEKATIDAELVHAREKLEVTRRLVFASKRYNPSIQNDQLIDQAIESKLILRNHSLEMEIATKRNEIEEKQAELDALNRRLEENARNIARSEDCIETLRARISENDNLDHQTLARYQQMIDKTNVSLSVFRAEEVSTTEQISVVTAALAKLAEEIDMIQRTIATNNDLLSTTLKIPTDEFNRDSAKDEEDRELKAREERIQELEAKRKAILENPSLLAAKAKEALAIDSDITTALTHVRKLVEIVSKIPYMDLEYTETYDEDIKALLQQAETERDSLVAEIEGKDYKADNTALENQKKAYLEERIASYLEAINILRTLVNKIDAKNGLDNTANVDLIDQAIVGMKQDLESYAKIDSSVELRESEILAARNKKQEQIEGAEDLKASYELDVIADANLASSIESQISQIGLLIANAQAELNSIESRHSLQRSTPEDSVAKAIDSKKKADAIKAVIEIKNRKKFKKAPHQILTEIEEIAGTILKPVVEEPVLEAAAPITLEPATDTMPKLDSTLHEGALKIDHILDLAKSETPEPVLTASPIDINQTSFEPATPIDLSTYSSAPITPSPELKVEPVVIDLEETKRGSKVVGVTPIELENAQEKSVEIDTPVVNAPEVETTPQNPFALGDGETHLFDFNGDLLNPEEDLDEVVDFNPATEEVHLGLGGLAA